MATNEEILAECKRDILVGESVKAVEKMAAMCKKLADEHGELNVLLAEPYYVYGCALLEVARMESCVLGNALDGIAGDLNDDSAGDLIEKDENPINDEEREKLSEQILDAICEKDEELNTSETVTTHETTNDQKETEVVPESDQKEIEVVPKSEDLNTESATEVSAETTTETTTETKKELENTDTEEKTKCEENIENPDVQDVKDNGTDEINDKEENANDENEGEDEGSEESIGSEDDVTNLQLSWEMFELAKKLFAEKGNDKEAQLMVADCHLKLGEIGSEKEDFTQALEDFQSCLSVLQVLCEPSDRRLAEVRYQMAMCKMQQNDYNGATQELNDCIASLKLQLTSLENDETAEDSRKRLEDLITDVTAMIGECKEEQLDFETAKKRFKKLLGGFASDGNTSTASDNDDSQTKDITHLVRKRKKEDEVITPQSEELPEVPVTKKVKVNGDALETVPTENGHKNGDITETNEVEVL